MRIVRFVLALAALAAAVSFNMVSPQPTLAGDADCFFQPGDQCKWHCTKPCPAGCCGDWERYAWSSGGGGGGEDPPEIEG